VLLKTKNFILKNMKKLILKTFAFFLILTGLFSSCKDPELKINYPVDIPFTEYSLANTSCRWMNLPYDEQIIIINSSEELENYIFCSEGSYPEIDFSKHTLLLVNSKTNHRICEITTTSLQQLSSSKYELNINITSNDADDTQEWSTAFIVEKLEGRSNVELNVSNRVIETKITLPIIVTDQRIIDFFKECGFRGISGNLTSCFFTTLGVNEDICLMINTMEEFRDAYEGTGDLPEIDFDNYTLIIGANWAARTGVYISNPKFIESCTLTFYAEFRRLDDGHFPTMCHLYHWGIYPKLSNKPFYVEYVQIYE